jgi:hypothetical protein
MFLILKNNSTFGSQLYYLCCRFSLSSFGGEGRGEEAICKGLTVTRQEESDYD